MNVLVGRKAPNFVANAVLADGTIEDNYNFEERTKDKYKLLVFYPLDFTFVCPSELIALSNRMPKFKELGVEVIAISIDSQYTHAAWRNTDTKNGGIGQVQYDMVADLRHHICQAYGVEHPEAGVAFRASFLIDKKNVVRAQLVNDLPLGRNIDELLRLVDALQFHENHGEVCPAGWQKGQAGMKATPEGVADYLADYATEL